MIFPKRPTPYYQTSSTAAAAKMFPAAMHPYFPATLGTGCGPHPAFMNATLPYTVTLNNLYFNTNTMNSFNSTNSASNMDVEHYFRYRRETAEQQEMTSSHTAHVLDLSSESVHQGSLPSSPGSACSESDRSLNTSSALNSSVESRASPKAGEF